MWEKAIKDQRTALLTGMCWRPVVLVRRVDSMRHPKHSTVVSDDDGDRSLNCGPGCGSVCAQQRFAVFNLLAVTHSQGRIRGHFRTAASNAA